MRRFLQTHPWCKALLLVPGAVVLAFVAYRHFANRSYLLLLADIPFVVGFVFMFFWAIADILRTPEPRR